MTNSLLQRLDSVLCCQAHADHLRRGYRVCRRLCSYDTFLDLLRRHLLVRADALCELSDDDLKASILERAHVHGLQLVQESVRFRETLTPEKVKQWLGRERRRCEQMGMSFDDLCQDVVVKALDKLPYLGRSEGEIVAWFQLTAHRLVSDLGKHRHFDAWKDVDFESGEDSPELLALNSDQLNRFVKFLVSRDGQDLEIMVRRCFVHRIIAEQKWESIAVAVNLTTTSVRQRYSRMLRQFHELKQSEA